MRLSRFCLARTQGEGVLALSAMSGSSVLIAGDLWNAIQSQELDEADPDAMSLFDAGIIVPDGTDDFFYGLSLYHQARLDTRSAHVVLMMTDACNLSCDYCIQPRDRSNCPMSEEVMDRVVWWLAHMIEQWDSEKVGVQFFGGEPLLELRKVQALAVRFSELRVPFSFSIVTNGTMLDGRTAETLKSIGLTTALVSIDGPREVHDRRRRDAQGGTFDRIIDNVIQASRHVPVILVVNLDMDNWQGTSELLSYLSEQPFAPGVKLSFGTIIQPADRRTYGCLATDDQKVEHLLSAYASAVDLGLPIEMATKLGACVYEREASIVVAPDGTLYDCIAGFGMDEFRVCSVFDDPQVYQVRRLARLGRSPEIGPACQSCSTFPVCRGGCVYERVLYFESTGQTLCRRAAIQEAYGNVIEAYARRHLPKGSDQ